MTASHRIVVVVTQPAWMVKSMAATEVVKQLPERCCLLAGFLGRSDAERV
jgi:hypothetical protein